jgi:TIR domain
LLERIEASTGRFGDLLDGCFYGSANTGAGIACEAASVPDRLAVSITPASHEIFVSYASDDRALVERIVAALETERRRCRVAHRDIPPGVPAWAGPIVTAIANSRLVLVLLTMNSIPSIEVLREVTLAATRKFHCFL